jgi:hypothetical protein
MNLITITNDILSKEHIIGTNLITITNDILSKEHIIGTNLITIRPCN